MLIFFRTTQAPTGGTRGTTVNARHQLAFFTDREGTYVELTEGLDKVR